jgi:hypothetical protein
MRVVTEVLHTVPKSCEDWRMNKSVNPWPYATCSAMHALLTNIYFLAVNVPGRVLY